MTLPAEVKTQMGFGVCAGSSICSVQQPSYVGEALINSELPAGLQEAGPGLSGGANSAAGKARRESST